MQIRKDGITELGKLLDDAIKFATDAHAGQMRKVGKKPYIIHPMEAAAIAGALTNDDEIIAAAILHDVAEDTAYSLEDIRERFGKRVAGLVSTETEDKRVGQSKSDTWKVRKEETLAKLKSTCDEGVKIMWIADKLSNIRSYYAGVLAEGDAFFDRFNQKDKKMHEWYYREILDGTSSFCKTAQYIELEHLVNAVFCRTWVPNNSAKEEKQNG
ncbi:MAG: bifunctional (p)ppGpp synthetase/guanosine-3',5'-bis(diphosphate) 3'-pyrophosphohydrolase [Clostridia bacterium]|nr:bifunctional (p)ppGpp synthetase/guanosine-3',5'-bis(diphosphate) 3'-pyrophosphohydrolase [Clostridia bacterium]